MRSSRRVVIAAVTLASVLLLVLGVRRLRAVRCESVTRVVAADGRFHPVARFWRTLGTAPVVGNVIVVDGDATRVITRAEPDGSLVALYRAPVNGGEMLLRLQGDGIALSVPIRAIPTWSDRVGDGLPDALRLHDLEDRQRFRRWFVALADHAAAVPERDLPPEITDCSALLRYSYRLALMNHDDRWYAQFAPGTMPVLPSVEQWSYPRTPLAAGLFRVTPVTKRLPQASDFGEFADAKTLFGRNSFRVGRDVRAARPGDLLFFHQLDGEEQYHSMIVTGESSGWVVYHTGPVGSGASRARGEMRRARMADLLQHPDPRWHPTASNPNFLGVFRWDLLRED